MTVSELIQQLQQLPDDTEVEIYHQLYNGGGDEDRFDTPLVRLDNSLRVIYLVPDNLAYALEEMTCTIDKLLE